MRKGARGGESASAIARASEVLGEGWQMFCHTIMKMNESELKAAIRLELQSFHPRRNYLARLHARVTRVRAERERARIAAGDRNWDKEVSVA